MSVAVGADTFAYLRDAAVCALDLPTDVLLRLATKGRDF